FDPRDYRPVPLDLPAKGIHFALAELGAGGRPRAAGGRRGGRALGTAARGFLLVEQCGDLVGIEVALFGGRGLGGLLLLAFLLVARLFRSLGTLRRLRGLRLLLGWFFSRLFDRLCLLLRRL